MGGVSATIDVPETDISTPTEGVTVTVPAALLDIPHREFRERWHDLGEKLYLEAQLRRYAGNVSKVSREIDLARTYTHKLIKKHGLFRRG